MNDLEKKEKVVNSNINIRVIHLYSTTFAIQPCNEKQNVVYFE